MITVYPNNPLHPPRTAMLLGRTVQVAQHTQLGLRVDVAQATIDLNSAWPISSGGRTALCREQQRPATQAG